MARLTYEQALEDHAYLWDFYGPAADMTGGYVDQDDLARLLRSPSKATARDCLVSQISYWFSVGPESGGLMSKNEAADDERVVEIAERYGEKAALDRLCG